ncbi:terpenoid cyclases/protein prenyltransferase alpha-alpha toroid [Aspergillus bertholletiae]|uniref:Terpenoid cyclases/protein prenyltransferase alpha-alpha toroid n=1 Tax=Aspergillus bertholletiae TaxID=1226010 RepID=A0A5N7B6W8_9EURO|nr:terpenoid cyclases/protein prenyltransferase alpha-alpha toroid [Aspergillus bertholletiae]
MEHIESLSGPTVILLHVEACDATKRAGSYALRLVREDGHWYGEMKSNATITAEYVFLVQALGFSIQSNRDDLVKYFLSEQNRDGSWSLAYDSPGDVSTTSEAYFALCLLGID